MGVTKVVSEEVIMRKPVPAKIVHPYSLRSNTLNTKIVMLIKDREPIAKITDEYIDVDSKGRNEVGEFLTFFEKKLKLSPDDLTRLSSLSLKENIRFDVSALEELSALKLRSKLGEVYDRLKVLPHK